MNCPRPTLTGPLVTLRPLALSDLELYYQWLQEPEGLRLTGTDQVFTRELVLNWLTTLNDKEDRVDLAIVPHSIGQFVGEIVLNQISERHRSANFRIGLNVHPHAGKGYGTEAMQLLLPWAFETLKLHRIELEVFSFNPRAQHVYRKLGFQVEGVRKECHWLEGAWHDAILMRLFREDLRLSS